MVLLRAPRAFAVNLASPRPRKHHVEREPHRCAALGQRRYNTYTREELAHIRSTGARLHGTWNDSIESRRKICKRYFFALPEVAKGTKRSRGDSGGKALTRVAVNH